MSLNQNIYKNKKSTKRERNHSLKWYLDEISRTPVLTRAEEIVLIDRAKNGNQQAAERLICANLLFVVSVAKEYQNRGLPLADLISEGYRPYARFRDVRSQSQSKVYYLCRLVDSPGNATGFIQQKPYRSTAPDE